MYQVNITHSKDESDIPATSVENVTFAEAQEDLLRIKKCWAEDKRNPEIVLNPTEVYVSYRNVKFMADPEFWFRAWITKS